MTIKLPLSAFWITMLFSFFNLHSDSNSSLFKLKVKVCFPLLVWFSFFIWVDLEFQLNMFNNLHTFSFIFHFTNYYSVCFIMKLWVLWIMAEIKLVFIFLNILIQLFVSISFVRLSVSVNNSLALLSHYHTFPLCNNNDNHVSKFSSNLICTHLHKFVN